MVDKERLEEIDEIASMISQGEEGVTSQGTHIIKSSTGEIARMDRVDTIMFMFSYIIIPTVVLGIIGFKYNMFDKTLELAYFMMPIIVVIIILKGIYQLMITEPWDCVLRTPNYYRRRRYMWWR